MQGDPFALTDFDVPPVRNGSFGENPFIQLPNQGFIPLLPLLSFLGCKSWPLVHPIRTLHHSAILPKNELKNWNKPEIILQ